MTTHYGATAPDPERDDKAGETAPTPEPRKERVALVLLDGHLFDGRTDVLRAPEA